VCGHLKRALIEINCQRVVSSCHKRGWDISENAFTAVIDGAGLAMHGQAAPLGNPPECLIYALHAQANPQNRDVPVIFPDERDGYPRVGGIPGTGTYDDVIRLERSYIFKGEAVATVHMDAEVIVHKHLHQIICEGIIIIYNQEVCQSNPQQKSHPDASLGGW